MKSLLSIAMVACIALTGCSSESPELKGLNSVLPFSLKGLLKKKNKTPVANPLAGITREQLKDIPGPLLFANLEQINAYASLSQIGENAGVKTFITPDRISLSTMDGIILATRGLGGDLISADVSGTKAAIRQRGASSYSRTMRWLDAQDKTIAVAFSCTMKNAGTEQIHILGTAFATWHLTESCSADDISFENDYWLGKTKPVIWKSRQWLGNNTGYIALQLLIE